jgi:hypothetical protein
MAYDIDTVLGWRGRTVRDSTGDKLGTFGDIYLDRVHDAPTWAGVKTGLFGRHESFVPISSVTEQDDDLVVPYTAEQVKDAPRVDPDVALTEAEEQALYSHYGQDYGDAGGREYADEGRPEDADTGARAYGEEDDREYADADGRTGEAPEPLAEGEMVRSEEEVRVSEGPMRPKERVRLRKVLVTEHQQQTVPVRKEVVQLETDAPPEGRIEAVEDADEAPR